MTPSMFKRYEGGSDPVVAALAKAHGVALEAREREVAKRIEADIKRLVDPAYGMYAALRDAVERIDQARYYAGFSAVKLSPTASGGLGEQGDQFLANLASKLTQAAVEYADRWDEER